MNVDGSNKKQLSKGGRTTCGYFFPDGKSIVYASTHLGSADARRARATRAATSGRSTTRTTSSARRPTDRIRGASPARPGYDAEATIGPDGRIVFTSVRDGDMEIYSMNGDGSDVRRLTNRPGPDGGPWFSPDGKQIVFRGRPISDAKELADYQGLLKEGLWRPTTLEIFVMNRDGSNLRQVTKLGGANFAPAWHPDGKRIIFASNIKDPKGRDFDIFMINLDGIGPRADHVQLDLRRVPDVLARRQEAGVRIESEREVRRRDERVCCGLGRVDFEQETQELRRFLKRIL